MDKRSSISLKDVFSAYYALIPILQYYISPVRSLNLATLISFGFLLVFVLNLFLTGKYRLERLITPVRIYTIFIVFSLFLTSIIFHYSFSWENISPTIRLIFLYICLIALGNKWFDVDKAFSILEKVLMISAFFIIIHTVLFSIAHIRVTPIIESLVTKDSLNLDLNRARTGGLYMEPAHYAQSAILYFCHKLFPLSKERVPLSKRTIFIGVGLIFSGSGQGYAMLAVVYSIWVFYTMFIEKASAKRVITAAGSILLVLIVFVALLQVPYVRNAVNRIIALDTGASMFGGQALAGRSYTNHYFREFSPSMKMTGVGFGHLAEITRGGFTNSLYAHLIQCGYPSLLFLGNILFFYFKNGSLAVRVHVVLYAIMITFTAMANPMMLCYFTQFYIGMCKVNEINLGLRSYPK